MNTPLREGLKKGIFITQGGVSKGQLSLFIFLFSLVPNFLNIISRHKSFFKFRGMGGCWGPGGHIKPPPFGPWQTLSVLRLTLCVVRPTFCMVGPSFRMVLLAFLAMCLTFCMSSTNFLKFFLVFWSFQREKYTFFNPPEVRKITFFKLSQGCPRDYRSRF